MQNLLDDERIFPTEIGKPFPSDFMEHIRNIFKRLFRVYAHIYYCHFERMGASLNPPLISTFTFTRTLTLTLTLTPTFTLTLSLP